MQELDFIHRYVPSVADHRLVLVLLHGTGGNEDDLIPLGKYLAPGAALLGVRGKVLENGMPRFFRRLVEGVFDEQDLIFRTHELARFLMQAREVYGFGEQPMVAVGYSNGANIAASLLLLEPTVLSGAVLFRAMVPLVPQSLPNLDGKPVLISSGRQDPLVPPDNSQRLAELLRQAGANVTLSWQNAGHGLMESELASAKAWLSEKVQ